MWILIVLAVLAILVIGGAIARRRQLARSRPAFERALTKGDRDLAAPAAGDPRWDRALLETAARRVYTEQYGAAPEALTLIEVIDHPGTEQDQAVFEAGGRRVVLGRRDGEWVPSA